MGTLVPARGNSITVKSYLGHKFAHLVHKFVPFADQIMSFFHNCKNFKMSQLQLIYFIYVQIHGKEVLSSSCDIYACISVLFLRILFC